MMKLTDPNSPEQGADDRSEAAQAGSPLTFTVLGKDYKAGRIRLIDRAAAAQKLHDKRLEALRRNRYAMTPAEYAEAMARCAAMPPTQDETIEYMVSEEGTRFLVWRCVNRYNPQITEAQWSSMMEEQLAVELAAIGDESISNERSDAEREVSHILFAASGYGNMQPPGQQEEVERPDPPTFDQPSAGQTTSSIFTSQPE